jgi:hypothetical protein
VPLGGLVNFSDELSVEGVADVHHEPDQSAASARQDAGRPIWPVAEPSGCLQHALPSCGAGSWDAAEHE